MRGIAFFLLACGSLAQLGLQAQDQTVNVRVYTDANGARFWVDGIPYSSAQSFLWPVGSKHTLTAEKNQTLYTGHTRFSFQGWRDTGNVFTSSAETVTVTASTTVTNFIASYTVEHLLRILFHDCNVQLPGDCRPPGTVSVGGSVNQSSIESWQQAGSSVILVASPNPGFVFVGWGQPLNFSTSFAVTVVMDRPILISSIFEPAKRVTLLTEPEFLMLAPDRTPTKAPADMDWALNSRHVLGVVSPQQDQYGKLWVFDSWSNGAENYGVYTVSRSNVPETLTARLVAGARVSFVTSPPGLKIRVDGRENWPSYDFVWGVGHKHQISAADQADARGRRFVFKGWSNGGAASQEVSVPVDQAATGMRLIANFEALSRLTIQTNPPNLTVMVDGSECRGSCTFDRPAGTEMRISAPAIIPLADSSRYELTGWSDGGAATRVVTLGENVLNLTAAYRSAYRLTLLAEPAEGAVFRIDPVSPDGFYAADTQVMLSAEPKLGYRFRRWEGDLAGTVRTGYLLMSVPRIARAVFEIVPYVEEKGVRNAAGETAEPGVAAGSIASIFGANLAPAYEAGPISPLAQSLQGVTVRLEQRLLPLLFVSPEQINLQVPSDLEEGAYPVAVRWEGVPEVAARLMIVRNAPGLFGKKVGNDTYAAAVHEDGSEITLESPARRSEPITLYGTGFGPYKLRAPDGFALPDSPAYPLADPLELLIGNTAVQPEWAGGAPGQVGVALMRFRLPAEVPAGALAVKVRVNGKESNAVLLAVE